MQNDARPTDSAMQGSLPPSTRADRTAKQPEINAPTFTEPTRDVPQIGAYDLTGPGLALRAPFEADPLLPDLVAYPHPEGLTIYPNTELAVEPFQADLLLYDHSDDLDTTRNLEEPDPLLPDLQHPDLIPQTHMQQRPGELDSSALQVLQQDATYQQLGHKMYPAVFMDQSGMNTSRSRHMDLLMRGLDTQEQ